MSGAHACPSVALTQDIREALPAVSPRFWHDSYLALCRWRSWNAFGNKIDQSMMIAAMDALVASNRTIAGKAGQSLCKGVGFCSAGVDEGWEACRAGVNDTQHDAEGRPTVNATRFPNMSAMVEYGHSLGLEVGWYENGCKCAEKQDNPLNYRGDIESLKDFGFDGVSLIRVIRVVHLSFRVKTDSAS